MIIILILILIVILVLIYIELKNIKKVLNFKLEDKLEDIRQFSATTAHSVNQINQDRAREWLKKREQEESICE
jgi:predicted Holliday junction resolvase-like endonuclease